MLSPTRGMMLLHLSVLVILLEVAILSQGRSLQQRGKRLLYHPTEPNKYPVQNEYYYPQIDGRPIYLPPIGQSAEDMKELLDYYYNRNEAFVPDWTSAPPFNYDYDGIQDKYYEDPSMSVGMVTDAFDEHQGDFHVLPGAKQSILSPTVNHDKYLEYENEFEDLDDSPLESLSKTKHGSKKPTHKPNVHYTKSMLEYTDEKDANTDEYYAPEIVNKFNKRTDGKHTKLQETESQVGYVDEKTKDTEEYDLPEIVAKTNKKPLKYHKLQQTKPELSHSSKKEIEADEYHAPEIVESGKMKKSKGKENQKDEYLEDEYEVPSVHKVVKKEKLDNTKKHQKDESSTTIDNVSYDYYEQPTLIKSPNKDKIKQNKKPNKGKRRKHQITKRYGMDTVDTLKVVTEKDSEMDDLESLALEKEFIEVKDDTKLNSENEKKMNYELKETPVHKEKVIKTETKENPEETIIRTESKIPEYKVTEPKEKPVKEKVVIKAKPKEKHEKTKIVKTEPEMLEYEESELKEKPVKEKVVKTNPKEKHENTKIVQTEHELSEYEEIETGQKEKPVKEKVAIKTEPKERTKIVKTEPEMPEYEENKPKEKPVKEVLIKTKPKEKHEKTKVVKPELPEYEKIEPMEKVVKTEHEVPEYEEIEPMEKVVKTEHEVPEYEEIEPTEKVVKTEHEVSEYEEIETEPKEKGVSKTVTKEKHEKTKIKAEPKMPEYEEIETEPKEKPGKGKEKVVVKTKPKVKPEKIKIKTDSKEKDDIEEYEDKIANNENPLEWQRSDDHLSNSDSEEDIAESIFPDFELSNNPNEALNIDESELDSENIGSGAVENDENPANRQRLFPNADSLKRLSSLNSNIWSLLFNPNAERNKLKKCMTRSNESGYCTYIQHCDVPNIASSLEELLINACVMDDVFIGICCPEFPVETVKVQWDQDTSNSDNQTEDEFVHSPDDCGIRSNEASKVQAWPWKAPLVSMSNGKIFCGGILINEEYVLTAAHCTTKIPRNQILVRLGQYNDSTGDDFAVVEIKRHAQYSPRTMHHDIALLKLGRRVALDDFTGVICLPEVDDDEEHEGEKALLLGWKGMFGTKSKSNEVLEVMDNNECKKKLRMNISSAVLCTEARNEDERACNADSGAPLVIEDDGKYEAIGILSWNRNDCDQRFPSTFSRVSRYVEWIRKHAV